MKPSHLLFLVVFFYAIVPFQSLENGLFRTPQMGWMSWGYFRCQVDCTQRELYGSKCINEELFIQMADIMERDGWIDAGYKYLSIDDCWVERERDPNTQKLVPNATRFPRGMSWMSKYVHSKGLKFGIYSDSGNMTCQRYPGSLHHYELDAHTFAEWGVDSLKFDGCYMDPKLMHQYYPQMARALNQTGRPIAYICSWPAYMIDQHPNLSEIRKYCNSWRNYNDVENNFESVNGIITWFAENQDTLTQVNGPGGWNDADQLVIGNGLSIKQSKIQMAIWAILPSPLMMGNDLRILSKELIEILQNRHVIAVNQDPIGLPGKRIKVENHTLIETWARHLSKNEMALVLVDRFPQQRRNSIDLQISLAQIGWKEKCAKVYELFSKQAQDQTVQDKFGVMLEPADVLMFRLSPCQSRVNQDVALRFFLFLCIGAFLLKMWTSLS